MVGDIRGFGLWTSRPAATLEVQEPFIKSFYDAMQAYVISHPDSRFKYTGDGFQIIKEFDLAGRKNGRVAEFIEELKNLVKEIRASIFECVEPKPSGFRLRIFSGYVFKLMVLDPNDSQRKRLIPEYVGYAINTTHRILKVNPEISGLCDGKLAAGKKNFFHMKNLDHPSLYPFGVGKEDVDDLKIIQI